MTKQARKKLLTKVLARDGSKCHYCLRDDLVRGLGIGIIEPNTMTLDRITPGIAGGRYVYDNVVIACFKCNNSRGTNQYDYFFQKTRRNLIREKVS
jgi:5-methylcytosine-specific restriction endonuclease McrA